MEFTNNIGYFPVMRNWMNGVNAISMDKDSNNLLIGLSELDIPEDIRCICKVDSISYVFFTRQQDEDSLFFQEFNLDKKNKIKDISNITHQFRKMPGEIIDLNSDGEFLYLLIKDGENRNTTFSVIKIHDFKLFTQKVNNNQPHDSYEFYSENRIDFGVKINNVDNSNDIFKIIKASDFPSKYYIILNHEGILFRGRYKSNKGYIIKVSAIDHKQQKAILSTDNTKNKKAYYILEKKIFEEIFNEVNGELNNIINEILDISFLKEQITAINYFTCKENMAEKTKLFIISTKYNLHAYNLITHEFYSLLSYKGVIEFRKYKNSSKLEDYNLLKDNRIYNIHFDNEGNAIGGAIPDNYINKLYSIPDKCIFFGSNKFKNWGSFLTYRAYTKWKSINSENTIRNNKKGLEDS